MKVTKFVCGWNGCKKSFSYTKCYGKHIDEVHPEMGTEPIELGSFTLSKESMKVINNESSGFIQTPRFDFR